MTDTPLLPPRADPAAWETLLDSSEQAFTLAMPRGWTNRVWLKRTGPLVTQLATAISPSGASSLAMGDPGIPPFVEPGAAHLGVAPGMVLRPYTSIEHFLPAHAQSRLGGLPGFRVLSMAPCPELFHLVGEGLRRAGAGQLWITAARLHFQFQEGGQQLQGLLLGSSTSLGPNWMVEVHGILAKGDPGAFQAALLGMIASRQSTPATHQAQMQARAAAAARHQATMAQLDMNAASLRAGHQQNMARIQGMAASHQAHMASLHQDHEAHNSAWQATQQAQDTALHAQLHRPDDSHRRFLNCLAEERTVVDAEGQQHQVADGYDRYFRRRSDGTWIATRGQQDLRDLPGVNPDDYDEARIRA